MKNRWVKIEWRMGSIGKPSGIFEISETRAAELRKNDWANGRSYTLIKTDKTVDQLWEEYDR